VALFVATRRPKAILKVDYGRVCARTRTNVVRIGLESGTTSLCMWSEFHCMGLPVNARHAKAVLQM